MLYIPNTIEIKLTIMNKLHIKTIFEASGLAKNYHYDQKRFLLEKYEEEGG